MTIDLERLAGQMIVASPEGPLADARLLELIEGRRIGGVILFRRSCTAADEVRQLLESLQRRAETPLFAMVDQEGGRVMRLWDDAFHLPSARGLARLPDDEIEYRVYLVANRLRETGFNVNLAPVLDVDTNPANPVIGDRAFGSDADVVWRKASAYRRGLEKAGVIPCGKHFPGHGDTDADSHQELPVVTHGRERLMRVEIEPFRRAAAAGFPMLMTAHVRYDALDPTGPATLSPAICTTLLRGELGFAGVLVSDDLEMKAVAGRHSPEQLAERLLLAGVDLFLVCHSYELADALARALARLARRDETLLERMKSSWRRILDLKRTFGVVEDSA